MRVLTVLFLFLFAVGCVAAEAEVAPANTEAVPTSTEAAYMATAVPDTPIPTQAATQTSVPTPTSTPATTERNADADVLHVRAEETAVETWTFTVTVWHPDTGWEDYADGWDVVLPDGTVAKPDPDSPFTRLLLHPHENEQPFIRSQSNIHIPAGVTAVTVRAHDLVDGFGGQELSFDLTQSEKTYSYEVIKLTD